MKNQVFGKKQFVVAFVATLGLHLGSAQAGPFLTDKAFDLTVGVNSTYITATDSFSGGTVSAPFGATNLQTLKNQVTDAGLKQINANYTDTGAAVIRAGYRGLPIIIDSQAGSKTVSLSIPAIGLAKSFSNSTTSRDDNTKDLFDYLKSDGGDILNQLQQKLALLSPIDPIAGNPSSMQSRMVMDDFDRSFTAFASNIKSDGSDGSTSNLVGVGLSLGSMTTGGINTTTTTIPLSYTIRNDLDPRKQFSFYAPVTSSDTVGAKAYGINLGVAYRLPVNDDWALTPALGYGVTGSEDLGSGASMFAASVTSQYSWKMDGYDLAMGNMVGVYQSTQLNAGSYSIDPKISNTVYRNGILASFPTSAFGQKMAIEASFILTNYTGTALYSNQYQEIGLTLGTNKSASSARTYVRAGATYLTGENGITGYKLNVGYWF
jgi:hypothetical protein